VAGHPRFQPHPLEFLSGSGTPCCPAIPNAKGRVKAKTFWTGPGERVAVGDFVGSTGEAGLGIVGCRNAKTSAFTRFS
jgi:hypothetical protein